MKTSRLLWLLLPCLFSCDEELPGDEICRDIGYAIANKSYECTGDAVLSNQRYEDFVANRTCKISEIPGEDQLLNDRISDPPRDSVGDPYRCSAAILRFSCDQISAFGDNYDQWLANADPGQCGAAYSSASGGSLPPASSLGGAGGEAGAAGAGGGGEAGAGGAGGSAMVGPPVIEMSGSGSVIGSPYMATQCYFDEGASVIRCDSSSGASIRITLGLVKLTPGYHQGFASVDQVVRLGVEHNGGFLESIFTAANTDGAFCSLTLLEPTPPPGFASFIIDLQLQNSMAMTVVNIKGSARNIPCGNACP